MGAFCRVETTAFGNGSSTPDLMAVRIAVTAADGNEAARVVRIGANDEEAVDTLVERLEAALGDTDRRELRLAAIARVLTASIRKSKRSDEPRMILDKTGRSPQAFREGHLDKEHRR